MINRKTKEINTLNLKKLEMEPLKIISDFVTKTCRRIHLPLHQLFLQPIAGDLA